MLSLANATGESIKADMTVKEAIKKVFLVDILKGMALTLRMMFTRPVTRQYPEEKREMFPGFRGRHAFVRDPGTGREKCVACLKCSTVCPSQCITIEYKELEDSGRILERYEIEAIRCIFCGYCVEICPVCALVLTEFYEYAGCSRDSFIFNREQLLKNWDEFVAELKTDTYFNKFWRLPGMDVRKMPAGKRLQGPVPVKPLIK